MTQLPTSPFLTAAVEPAEALPAEDPGTDHIPAGSAPIEDDISCIGEIFVGALKLDDHRFVLDVERFMIEIEEPPLFLRRAHAQ
jgi:hypothetical protein